jgi:hypothetical protein
MCGGFKQSTIDKSFKQRFSMNSKITCQILTFRQWYPLNICTHNTPFSSKTQRHIVSKRKCVQLWWKKEHANDENL